MDERFRGARLGRDGATVVPSELSGSETRAFRSSLDSFLSGGSRMRSCNRPSIVLAASFGAAMCLAGLAGSADAQVISIPRANAFNADQGGDPNDTDDLFVPVSYSNVLGKTDASFPFGTP